MNGWVGIHSYLTHAQVDNVNLVIKGEELHTYVLPMDIMVAKAPYISGEIICKPLLGAKANPINTRSIRPSLVRSISLAVMNIIYIFRLLPSWKPKHYGN